MSLAERDRVFAEPWQAQAFALAVALSERGAFSWSEWSAALGAELSAGAATYDEAWLTALEGLLAARGLTDRAELASRKAAWERAYRATPHGQAVSL